MKILAVAAAAMLLIPVGMSAQTAGGGISADMLKEISKGYAGTAADKALRNALNTTSITVLAENADNLAMIDTHFSDKVKTRGITDQKSSGRCWLFSGLNVLRARMIDRFDLGDFTFSQNYLFFYDQLEKANLFLQGVIDTRDLPFEDRKVDWLFANPIGDGGQFTGVSNLIMKYGLVPADVMPETYVSNSTSEFCGHLKRKLREFGIQLREKAEASIKDDTITLNVEAEDWESLQLKAAMAVGALLIDKKAHQLVINSSKFKDQSSKLIELADGILQAARIKFTKTEYISCPGCGRTLYNLQETIARIKAATKELVGLKIGIMGCIVNGPGEMADADYGYVGAGRGKISLYKAKECVEKNIPEEEAVEKLLELIRKDRAQ